MLIVVGSRRDGNCSILAQKVKETLDKERIHCEIITPGNQKIHLCTGCMDCDKDGICGFTDDMKSNIDKIKNEEYLVFITPTRWNLLSGDLKIFMDRLNPLYSTQGLKGKKLIAVAIGAKDKNLYSSESALTSLLSFGESAKMECIYDYQFDHCLNANDILNQEQELNEFINQVKTLVS